MEKEKTGSDRTVGIAFIIGKGKLHAWLIQAGITPGKDWEWRIVVSKAIADNDTDALKIAQERYRSGQASEIFEEKAEQAA